MVPTILRVTSWAIENVGFAWDFLATKIVVSLSGPLCGRSSGPRVRRHLWRSGAARGPQRGARARVDARPLGSRPVGGVMSGDFVFPEHPLLPPSLILPPPPGSIAFPSSGMPDAPGFVLCPLRQSMAV